MKILFVDHIFHQKTRSSEFFRSLLKRFFDVRTIYVDPDDPARLLEGLGEGTRDLVVLWQMDYLAPIFLAMGLRVVVIPMYDGSANMPDVHWLWAKQARFVNFSRQIHAKVTRCGSESLLVKYFKPPVRENQIKTFDKLNVLLWQRRPEHGINLHTIERLLGDQISTLHVHDTPDDELIDSAPYLKPTLSSYALTTSTWFKSSGEYARLLDAANVFIAPRRSEGIGMAFIEAMSRGCLVFASDDATHDEYIANWVNGVLFNPDNVGHVEMHGREAGLGRMAWKTAQQGYERWLAAEAEIVEFIRTTPKPVFDKRPDPADFARSLIAHYEAGIEQYKSFLMSNMHYLDVLYDDEVSSRVLENGMLSMQRIDARSAVAKRHLQRATSMPWLEQNRFDPSVPGSGRYVMEGNFHIEDDCAWIAGDGLTFGFALDPSLGVTDSLRVSYRRVDEQADGAQYLLMLNGWSIGIGMLSDAEGDLVHTVPAHTLKRNNVLRIQILRSSDKGSAPARGLWGLAGVEFA